MSRPDPGAGAGLIILAILAITLVAPCVVFGLMWLHKALHSVAQ